jgi:hypothetical protein
MDWLIMKFISQCDVTDKNNDISFESLDKHFQTLCDASDNVCLNIQNCLYSIYSVFIINVFYSVHF